MREFVRNRWNEEDTNGEKIAENVDERKDATISVEDKVDMADSKENFLHEEPFLVSTVNS